MLLSGNLALPLSLTSFHHWLFWLWYCLCSLSSGVASSSTTLWYFTALRFASAVVHNNVVCCLWGLASLRLVWEIHCLCGSSVVSNTTVLILWAVSTFSVRVFIAASGHGVVPLVHPTPLGGHRSSYLTLSPDFSD